MKIELCNTDSGVLVVTIDGTRRKFADNRIREVDAVEVV